MEHNIDRKEMLDLMLRPAFLVEDGIIRHVNPSAAHLLLHAGQAVLPLIRVGQEEYRQFQSGSLQLTLSLADTDVSTTVIQQGDGQIFLPDLQSMPKQFRSLSLAAMQLREPLAALSILLEQNTNPDNAGMINRRLHQLLRVVTNMSDAARFADPGACRKEYTEICGFLEEILEKADTLMGHIHLSVERQLPRENIFTRLDREQLERSVYNLLSNAAKFAPESGTVQVKLSRVGNKLQLSVQSKASHGFSDFYDQYLRQPTLEDPIHGLGLGMALVRSTAANHGGALLIDHPSGTHTRVTMTLAIDQGKGDLVRSPILHLDYAGERDHGLLELSDVLPAHLYAEESYFF